MTKKILLLNNQTINDNIENPTLSNFNLNKTKKKNWPIFQKNISNENIFFENDVKDSIFLLKKKMINLGLNNIFNITEELCNILFHRLSKIKENEVNCENIMNSIYYIFIEKIDNYIIKQEFSRLKNIQAINYYQSFLIYSKNNSIQQNIYFLLKYFKKRIEEKDTLFYIGIGFGQIMAQGVEKQKFI